MNPLTNRERDCPSCRAISGGGLLGMAAYVSYCSRRVQGYSKFGVLTLGAGLGALGLARLLNLPPFKEAFSSPSV